MHFPFFFWFSRIVYVGCNFGLSCLAGCCLLAFDRVFPHISINKIFYQNIFFFSRQIAPLDILVFNDLVSMDCVHIYYWWSRLWVFGFGPFTAETWYYKQFIVVCVSFAVHSRHKDGLPRVEEAQGSCRSYCLPEGGYVILIRCCTKGSSKNFSANKTLMVFCTVN